MYIPAPPETAASGSKQADSGSASQTPATQLRGHQSLRHPLRDAACDTIIHPLQPSHPDLRKRDPLQSTDVTIGAVVGVLLGVFIVGTIFFCVRYHRSIRFANRRRKRHHHHRSGGSSRGSKASTSSASTAAASPPAPPAPPPEAPAA